MISNYISMYMDGFPCQLFIYKIVFGVLLYPSVKQKQEPKDIMDERIRQKQTTLACFDKQGLSTSKDVLVLTSKGAKRFLLSANLDIYLVYWNTI